MRDGGPWQAWVAAGLTTGSTGLYLALVTGEGLAEGDLSKVIAIAGSLTIAAVCAAGAALVRSRRISTGLLVIALIPLATWGVLGASTIGGLFLLSGAFVGAALWAVSRSSRERDGA